MTTTCALFILQIHSESFSANGNRFKGDWLFDREEGEGYLKIEDMEVHGIWKNGVLINELSARQIPPQVQASAEPGRKLMESRLKLASRKPSGLVPESENDTEDHLNISSKNLMTHINYINKDMLR